MDKLFIVTRADLPWGQQAVQAIHAQVQFAKDHPEVERAWFEESNTVALLVVRDEHALGVLYRRAVDRYVPVSAFREPDRAHEMTAIAIGPQGKNLTKGLPLAYHDAPQKRQPDHQGGRHPVPLDG